MEEKNPNAGSEGRLEERESGQSAPGKGPAGAEKSGFFATLFDFSFTRYIFPKIIRVIYMALAVFIGLSGVVLFLAFLVGSFKSSGVVMTLVLSPLVLILVALGGLLCIIYIRTILETVIAMIRTSEYTRDILKHLKSES